MEESGNAAEPTPHLHCRPSGPVPALGLEAEMEQRRNSPM